MLSLMSKLTATPNIVNACFDESGKWTDAEGVFAFAGIVAFLPALHELNTLWVARLNTDELPYTSMKDAVHYQGPWLKFKNAPDKRDSILCDLASIVRAAKNILRVGSPMDTATTQAFNALPKQEQKALGGNPYYGGFEACILGALQPRADTVLHIVCDMSEEYAKKCISALHKIMRIKPEVKERCLGIAFADDKRHTGLQVADMLAYCSRAEVLKRLGKPVADPVVDGIIEILRPDDVEERRVIYRISGELGGIGEAILK